MTKDERHKLIIDTLMMHESIQVSDLSLLLDVSAVTIRKDLTELEKLNKLYRSHGRAILINPYINNRSVNEKEKLARSEKEHIGRMAASLITKDDSIIIASGTTVLAFARCIRPIHRLTVISASIQVSEILAANESIDVVQLGGSLRTSSLSVVGKYAESPLAEFSCSKLSRCRRNRPRLRDNHNRHTRGRPQQNHDAHGSEDNRACRLVEIPPPRIQQNRQHG